MSYINVWLHFVFVTKNRHPYLNSTIRKDVFDHIQQNAKSKGIYLDHINGYKEHIHCLISLNQMQTIAKVAQMIKGESSRWINQNKLTQKRFEWQIKYYCASVSESRIKGLRSYIRFQDDHHKSISFQEEVEKLFKTYKGDDGLKPDGTS